MTKALLLYSSRKTSVICIFPWPQKPIKKCRYSNLGGDSKIDQDTFLLEPVSAENLHNNRSCRNFWFAVKNSGVYSAAGVSANRRTRNFLLSRITVN